MGDYLAVNFQGELTIFGSKKVGIALNMFKAGVNAVLSNN
jgi:hypothetical protein